jgi:hypothetical protein
MKRLVALFLGVMFVFSQSQLMAKGGRGGGKSGQGNGSLEAQNSHSNGQGTTDRDFGKDRAAEVGKGKEKGLHKDQYSIGNGGDKNPNHDLHKKDKVKKQHKEKKEKD